MAPTQLSVTVPSVPSRHLFASDTVLSINKSIDTYIITSEVYFVTVKTRIQYNLRHDHQRISSLTLRHSYANMTRIPWRYTGCAKMNLLYVKAFESYRITAWECMHLVRRGHFRSRDKKMAVIPLDPLSRAPAANAYLVYLGWAQGTWLVAANIVLFLLNLTSRSAVADKALCKVAKLWQNISGGWIVYHNVVAIRQEAQLPLCPTAQKTFRNAEPLWACELSPMFK